MNSSNDQTNLAMLSGALLLTLASAVAVTVHFRVGGTVVSGLGLVAAGGVGLAGWRLMGRNRVRAGELREAWEFRRRILENSDVVIVELSSEGRLFSASKAGAASPDWTAQWVGESREVAVDAIARARSGERARFRGWSRGPVGEPVLWEVIVAPVAEGDGPTEKLVSLARDITNQHEGEEKFRLLFENSAAVYLLLAEGAIIDASPAAARLLGGGERRDFLKRELDELSPETQPDGASSKDKARALMEAATTEGSCVAAWQFRRADGEEVSVEITLTSGALSGRAVVLAALQEVGENRSLKETLRASEERVRTLTTANLETQQTAERVVQESERRFRELFDDAPVAYHELDLDNHITRVNGTELVMLGYTAEEMVGKSVWSFIIEEKLDEVGTRESPHGARSEFPCTFRRKDGRKVSVLLRQKLIKDASGAISGRLVTLQDVTTLKRTELKLRDAEEEYRSIFENAIEGIFQSTAEGSYLSVNPALARMFGYDSPDEMMSTVTHIGRQLYVQPGRRGEFTSLILEQGAVSNFESEVYRREGSSIWISEHCRAVRDGDGKLLYYEGTAEDITVRRGTEHAVKSARDTAIESARLKSEFLANMSHEIRTPMNGIIGMTDLLLDTEMTPKQRDFTQTIAGSADSLLTIINDILDFSKIEAGMLSFEEIDFQLSTVVEGAVEVLAARAAAKKIDIASLVYNGVPNGLRGDPGRLRQVLTNLISNAVKFTERGEVVVRANCQEETTTHAVIRFTVTDSGIGIDPAAQAQLFQAFVQADGTTTRRFGGTGLGLAICRQLVQRMGGEIGVVSQPGKGSTFWFTARFVRQAASAPSVAPRKAELRDLRVLVVDDHETNRAVLEHLLSSRAMHVQQSVNALEALGLMRAEAARGRTFDLAILDMQMPGMDGLELARCIKKEPKLATTRIVMLTSMDRHNDPEALRESGVDGCLVKPVKQAQLFECLRMVMSPDVGAGEIKSALVPLPKAVEIPAELVGLNLRVLVAEDNSVNQKVAACQLERFSITPDVVGNGRLAIEAVRRTSYDVILMDCQMPELDGYAATRELRISEGSTRRKWIIAMTANSLEGDREKCLAAGMDDYLSKPIKPEALAAALCRYAQRRRTSEIAKPAALTGGIVDAQILAGFREMGADQGGSLLRSLIETFLENTPQVIAAAREALAGRVSAELERAAHTLKGSSSNFGAERMGAACAELERAAHDGVPDGAAAMIAAIESEFASVRIALERERSTCLV